MSFIDKRKLFEDEDEFISANPILSSTFYLNKDQISPVVLVLTNKSVFYHPPDNKIDNKGFMINFDTIFQVLRPKYKP